MRRSLLKPLLLAVAVVVIGMTAFFLLFHSKARVDHFSFVPAGSVVVATVNTAQLIDKAGLPELNRLPAFMQLTRDLANSNNPFKVLIGQLANDHSLTGIDIEKNGALFFFADGETGYIAYAMSVGNPKKLKALLNDIPKKGVRHDRSSGYNRMYQSDWLIGWNSSAILMMMSINAFQPDQIAGAFEGLVKLPGELQFFNSHNRAADLLAGTADIVCWIERSEAQPLASDRYRWMADIASDLSVEGVLMKVAFLTGEIVIDAEIVHHEKASEQVSQARRDIPEEMLRYHPARDRLAFAGLTMAPEEFAGAMGKEGLPGSSKLLKEVMKSIPDNLFDTLVSTFMGDILLTVTHPDISIGSIIADALALATDIDDPFTLLNPAIRITASVDPEAFDKMIPQLINSRLLAREANYYRIIPRLKFMPAGSKFSTLYVRRIGDMVFITNRRDEVAKATEASSGEQRNFTAEQILLLSENSFAMDINVRDIYKFFGNIEIDESGRSLPGIVDRAGVTSGNKMIRIVVSLKDKRKNSLNMLIEQSVL